MPVLDAESPSRRLKAATAALHQRVEDGVDILGRTGNVGATVELLGRMEAFYRAFEPQIASQAFFIARLPRLQIDLDALAPGWSPLPAPSIPRLESPVGGLYVVEGAALGGQIIARHLRERLRFDSTFFGGEGVGPRWRAFRELLDATDDYAAVERSAIATFLAFEAAVVRPEEAFV